MIAEDDCHRAERPLFSESYGEMREDADVGERLMLVRCEENCLSVCNPRTMRVIGALAPEVSDALLANNYHNDDLVIIVDARTCDTEHDCMWYGLRIHAADGTDLRSSLARGRQA